MEKTVVVLSGGMDSVTLLHRIVSEVGAENTKAISFNYGQRHSRELEFARANTLKLGVEHKIVDISTINDLLGGSSLTDDIAVPHGHYADENMKKTVVPNRNSIMANIAIGYAVSLEFDRVALGVHAGDHAIYPDCRPEFIEALNNLAQIANYKAISIYAPYLNDTKVEIVKDGLSLGVDYGLTWTCYEGKIKACGKCGSCQERLEAFEINGKKDPLIYEA